MPRTCVSRGPTRLVLGGATSCYAEMHRRLGLVWGLRWGKRRPTKVVLRSTPGHRAVCCHAPLEPCRHQDNSRLSHSPIVFSQTKKGRTVHNTMVSGLCTHTHTHPRSACHQSPRMGELEHKKKKVPGESRHRSNLRWPSSTPMRKLLAQRLSAEKSTLRLSPTQNKRRATVGCSPAPAQLAPISTGSRELANHSAPTPAKQREGEKKKIPRAPRGTHCGRESPQRQ